MLKRFLSLLPFLGAALGCGSLSSLPAADAGPDAAPADGGGVCCPITASAGCSPHGVFGGWQANAAGCQESSAFDGPPYRVTSDSHGCAVLVDDVGGPACGQAVPPGEPAPLSPANYAQACKIDNDCELFIVPQCDRPSCGCPSAAINKSDDATYQADLAAYRQACAKLHPGVACGDLCINAKAMCCGGTCVYREASSAHCDLDAGSD